MKKIVALLLLISHYGIAQPKNGQPVPDIPIRTLLNAPVTQTSIGAQRGKLILLEFWATWCSPCVAAMPHLEALQKRHASQLRVITVTDETAGRIQQYLNARPSSLWFAIDTARAMTVFFPHHLIPHTVLISPDGKLVAQTIPERITDGLIDSLWRRQEVHITPKVDNPMELSDIMKTYFQAADTVKNRFIMQGGIAGASSVQMTHLQDSVFKHRRLTCVNLPLTTLLRIAHGNYSYRRTIDKTGLTKNPPRYCLDLIVDKADSLLPTLRAELTNRFATRASLENQPREVKVLRILDVKKFNQVPRNPSGQRTYAARQGSMDQQAVTLADLADFLETYGSDGSFVVDETGNQEKLDITFSYQPEDPQSLTTALTNMGLGLVKQQRSVLMLVLQNQE